MSTIHSVIKCENQIHKKTAACIIAGVKIFPQYQLIVVIEANRVRLPHIYPNFRAL